MANADRSTMQCLAGWQALIRLLRGNPLSPGQEVDWPAALRLARRHGVAAYLYWRLRPVAAMVSSPACAEDKRKGNVSGQAPVPAEVERALQAEYYSSVASRLAADSALDRVLAELNDAGVPVVLLKGAALARTVYPEAGLRSMGDVDLLVPHEYLDLVDERLIQLGYQWQLDEKAGYRPAGFVQRFGKEWSYSGSLHLEVHYKVIGGEWVRRVSRMEEVGRELVARARPLPGTNRGLCLTAEDTLLHLSVHLAINHAFAETALRNLLDIHLLTREEEVDWRTVIEQARSWHVQLACYAALDAALRLFEAPIPDDVLDVLRPGALRVWLLDCVLNARVLVQGPSHPCRLRRLAIQWLLTDRPTDAARLLWRTFFPEREWLVLRYALVGAPGWRVCMQRAWHPLRVVLQGEV